MNIQKSYSTKNCLYIIPTPIGNMDDITYRIVEVLKKVEIIFCEDTRVTGQLLKHIGITKKMVCCNDINEDKVKGEIISELQLGKDVGFLSDRGTPVISDPGYKTIVDAIKNEYNVICLPGPTAFVPALVSSGLLPSPFLFYGFLNSKVSKRNKELEKLKSNETTMIFYEAPHRLISSLQSMKKILGNRKISVAREITKLYEEIFRGTIEEAIQYYQSGIKGEFVIIVEGAQLQINEYQDITIKEHVDKYVSLGFTNIEAFKLVAKDRGLSKSDIYKMFHAKEE